MMKCFFVIFIIPLVIYISILIRKYLKEVILKELKNADRFTHGSLKNRIYGFWVACFASSLVLGFFRPIFGFLGIILGPIIFRLFVQFQRHLQIRKYDEEMLSILMTLGGMIKSGFSLSAALRLISNNETNEIALSISRYLEKFESGKSFEEIIESFERRSGIRYSRTALRVLAIAQSKGISTAKLIDHVTDYLQNTLEMERRICSIRVSAIAQGVIATLLPWGVFLFLSYIQPEITSAFFSKTGSISILIFCILLQALGGSILWKFATFR